MQKIIIISSLLILLNVIIALLIIFIPSSSEELNQDQTEISSTTIREITELIPTTTNATLEDF